MLSYKGSWAEYTVYIMMLVEALMTKKGMSLVSSVTCYTSLGQTKKEKVGQVDLRAVAGWSMLNGQIAKYGQNGHLWLYADHMRQTLANGVSLERAIKM